MSLARGAPRRLCVRALVRFCAVQACGAASNWRAHTPGSGCAWGAPLPPCAGVQSGEALPPRIQKEFLKKKKGPGMQLWDKIL